MWLKSSLVLHHFSNLSAVSDDLSIGMPVMWCAVPFCFTDCTISGTKGSSPILTGHLLPMALTTASATLQWFPGMTICCFMIEYHGAFGTSHVFLCHVLPEVDLSHSTAQHSTAQHSTAQHSTAQHSRKSLCNTARQAFTSKHSCKQGLSRQSLLRPRVK